jgi:hypothetical protein
MQSNACLFCILLEIHTALFLILDFSFRILSEDLSFKYLVVCDLLENILQRHKRCYFSGEEKVMLTAREELSTEIAASASQLVKLFESFLLNLLNLKYLLRCKTHRFSSINNVSPNLRLNKRLCLISFNFPHFILLHLLSIS